MIKSLDKENFDKGTREQVFEFVGYMKYPENIFGEGVNCSSPDTLFSSLHGRELKIEIVYNNGLPLLKVGHKSGSVTYQVEDGKLRVVGALLI